MTVREYIGARYVPLFIGDWDDTITYEPLSIVIYQGNSYTSRQYVPSGIEITNTQYWALTGNYNAQIEQYRQEVAELADDIEANETAIENEVTAREEADGNLRNYIDGEIADLKDYTDDEISDEATARENADNLLDARISAIDIEVKSNPNFRCIDRFIFGDVGLDNVYGAQAGCVFTQDGVTYWAQIMDSSTSGKDHLIIRNIEQNTVVADITGQFGHGYTISYNPTTKQLLTQDSEQTPYEILIINVLSIANPYIERTIIQNGVTLDNPCWFNDEYIIGSIGDNIWRVYDLDLNVIDNYIADFHGYSYANGYVFQNICWYNDTDEVYIGVTAPDGIIICDIDHTNKKFIMKDFIATNEYYGCLYMRELEFAYRNGNNMYINQFDEIDGLLVVSLLEWNIKNGTIPNENSDRILAAGPVNFYIDWDNGSLIPNSSGNVDFKLAGDAINELLSLGSQSRGYLHFKNDYPKVVYLKSARVCIETNTTSASLTIKGIYGMDADVLWNTSVPIYVLPSLAVPSGGVTHNVGMRFRTSKFNVLNGNANGPILSNPQSLSNVHRMYFELGEYTALIAGAAIDTQDWFRWSVMNMPNSSAYTNGTYQNCVKNVAN